MNFKGLILILTFIIVQSNLLFAQEPFILKGLVFEKGNSARVEQATIINKRTNEKYKTDEFGNFELKAALGDTLLFTKLNYDDLIKVISVKQNLVIYLSRSIELKEVVVKEQSKKLQQQEILDGYRSKGVFFNGKPPVLAYIFSPLTALNELIGSDANNARKFGEYISRENAESEVDRHFNSIVIKKAINIEDKDIAEFMYLYRPKPEEVQYWNYYDDMDYIRKSYSKYLKYKKEQRP